MFNQRLIYYVLWCSYFQLRWAKKLVTSTKFKYLEIDKRYCRIIHRQLCLLNLLLINVYLKPDHKLTKFIRKKVCSLFISLIQVENQCSNDKIAHQSTNRFAQSYYYTITLVRRLFKKPLYRYWELNGSYLNKE